MREVNKAYGLPNPPTWYQTIFKSTISAIIKLAKKVTRYKGDLVRPTPEAQRQSPPNDRHAWTINHGFYAIMGGLALNVGVDLPEAERFLPFDDYGTWFLKSDAFLLLLTYDDKARQEFPNLSKEEIKSKSKANGLAKTLVCSQVLWFIAQCLTRRK
ncbi:MAG: hypothetical protein Q9195_007352 [Heterodermia aff. obscurata]